MATRKIYDVQEVRLELDRESTPALFLQASGRTRTTGYSNPTLVSLEYTQPPADGIQDYDFVAEEPGGLALQALTPIRAVVELDQVPDWFRGVRIHSETNQFEAVVIPA
jgi:hypothetical protein